MEKGGKNKRGLGGEKGDKWGKMAEKKRDEKEREIVMGEWRNVNKEWENIRTKGR